MSNPIDHAKALNGLLKTLKHKYECEPPPERAAIDELVLAFLTWEATAQKAEAAFRRIMSAVVDINELRVCRPPEIVSLLGKTYPRAEERAMRLKAALNEIYLREFAVTLDPCVAMNKRDARKYIETLEGMPPYVAARVVLLRLGGHALPVDDKLLARLIDSEVIEAGSDIARASGVLERHVKAGDAVATHALFQNWSDDPASEPDTPREVKPARADAKSVAPSAGSKKAEAKPAAPEKAPRKRAARPAARSSRG